MSKGKRLALFGGILLILIAAVAVIAVLQNQGIMPTGEESSEESSWSTETEHLLERVYQGSVSLMVSSLAKKQTLSQEEIDKLYAILREMEEDHD